VTDIFFSYSSKDRERVRPVHDALVAQGFEVFWDQQVPTGLDWDNWIRQHLKKCKIAMAFWSEASVSSDNVRHEATVAKQHGKLISVLLEPLTAEQFPMGLYVQQAANLSGWNGDLDHEEWRKFRREFEAKLTPGWVRQHIDELEAELVGERARREGAERRDKTLQAQIAKEAETQLVLQRERDRALDEIAALKGTVAELTRARSEAEARETDTLQQVAALRTTVDEVTRARSDAEQRLSKVRQIKANEVVRSVSPFVIAAAVATVGIWTYQLIWPAPQPLPAVISDSTTEAGQQQLAAIMEEQQRQAKAAADTQGKLEAAEAEQQRLREEVQRQAKAAADADAKRQAAEAEQQRLTKAAGEADSKRKTAEAEQQELQERLRNELQRQAKATSGAEAQFTAGPKKILGMELVSMSDDLRKRYGIKDTVKGLVITGVDPNSPAADKRLSPGNVIKEFDREVAVNVNDFEGKIQVLRLVGARTVLLLVAEPDGEQRFVAVNLN
jgi:TIR domain